MASQSLCGLDTLFSAIDEGSCQQTTPANTTKYDETAGILLGLASKSIPCAENHDASAGCESRTHEQPKFVSVGESTGEETESDEDTESDTEIPEPKEKKVDASLMVVNRHEIATKMNRYDTASELVGCSFEYNGVKIPLYAAEVNGRIQTMLVPCVMVHELVKHWENPLAQKEARRFYVNKLINACRESGAVLPRTYYIEFGDRRGARFHAIGLDALSTMLLDHESTSAKKWVKLANQLINTPADKKPPRKRKRDWVSDSFSNRKNPVGSS